MAGGVARFSGGVLIMIGVVLLVAGIVALFYGLAEEDENQEKGLFGSQDESEMNEALIVAGGVGMLAGLIVAVVGIAFVVGGQARRDKVQQQSVVHVVSGDDAVPLTAQQQQGTSEPGRPSGVVAVVVAAVVVLLGTVIWAAVDNESGNGLFGNDAPQQVGFHEFHGSYTGMAGFDFFSSNSDPLDVPARARFVDGALEWTASPYGGADQLRLVIERYDGGSWAVAYEAAGASPVLIAWDVSDEAMGEFRFRVEPVGNTPVYEQGFDLHLAYWDE